MEPLLSPEGDPADAEAGYAALLPHSPPPRAAAAAAASFTPYIEKETSRTVRKLLARAGLGHAQPPPQQQQPATALHPAPPAAASTKDGLLEGLDFSLFASAVNLASLRPTSAWEWRLRALKRWLLCLATGVATALRATAIIFSTKHLAAVKSNAVAAFTAGIAGAPSSADVATAFSLFAGLSVAFAVAALGRVRRNEAAWSHLRACVLHRDAQAPRHRAPHRLQRDARRPVAGREIGVRRDWIDRALVGDQRVALGERDHSTNPFTTRSS
jgi:hypothetical protein